ncbi:MAG: hypothetical protein AB1631_22630 [Acidobacteriota bacterium]
MRESQQIKKLLDQVPDEAAPHVIRFLRSITGKQKSGSGKTKMSRKSANIARRSFGMIPADVGVVRDAMAEDLYEFE